MRDSPRVNGSVNTGSIPPLFPYHHLAWQVPLETLSFWGISTLSSCSIGRMEHVIVTILFLRIPCYSFPGPPHSIVFHGVEANNQLHHFATALPPKSWNHLDTKKHTILLTPHVTFLTRLGPHAPPLAVTSPTNRSDSSKGRVPSVTVCPYL